MDLNQAVESRTSLFKSHAAAVSSKLRLEEQVKGTQQAFLKYQVSVSVSFKGTGAAICLLRFSTV